MKLSVVILNYNVRYFLELCLQSVEAATEHLNAEIIVIDNNSSDNSCEMVKQGFPNVKLIENKSNSGFSKGNNLAVKQAKGKYICILNPDTVVAEDTFLKLLKFAESQEHLGIIGCQLIDGRGQFLPESKRNTPTPKVSLMKLLGNSSDYYANQVSKQNIGKIHILVGAFMFMKRDVYNLVGGFDEDYFMYGEDVDLSHRVAKAGFINYYYGETKVIHFKGESTLKDIHYAKRFYSAMQIFYKKHFNYNSVFNMVVSAGIKLAYVFRPSKKVNSIKTAQTIVVSNQVDERLTTKLQEPILITDDIDRTIESHSKVVFDCNYFSYKSIIEAFQKNASQQSVVFRILPKNSKFILGSDSASDRGEVVHF